MVLTKYIQFYRGQMEMASLNDHLALKLENQAIMDQYMGLQLYQYNQLLG